MTNGFFAYPSKPPEVKSAINAALDLLRQNHGQRGIESWEENDIAGRPIVVPIFEKINNVDFLFADITRLNFNVTYEIGYAIGRGRRIILVRNGTIRAADELIQKIGIFDTLGYETYTNSKELVNIILKKKDIRPLKIDHDINNTSPAYLVLPRYKTDFEIHITSKIKKARIQYRSFDPEEQGRLSAMIAISNVSASHGVVVPLLSTAREDAETHNQRAAFVAGLATGMDKELLLLQQGDDPVPLDYRDFVSRVSHISQTDKYIGDFASAITARLQHRTDVSIPAQESLLAALSLGASTAENEMGELDDYYLETEEFRRALRGEAQIVAGRKGAGKSALFFRVRNKLRKSKERIVLDLRPEGFQLLKFKDVVLEHLERGTKEHTVTAFWEYLLLLETCYKILTQDRTNHLYNHDIYDSYRSLADAYKDDPFIAEADFAERLLKLTQRIANDFENALGPRAGKKRLDKGQVTNLLYKHDAKTLRDMLSDYLQQKESLWILFDNLDKGWPPNGLEPEDLTMLRCLIDASYKIQNHLRNKKIKCHSIIFLRNDIYELLLENTSDRGKTTRITIDWSDPELLRELLRLRFVASGSETKDKFDKIWQNLCVSHVGIEESSDYIIDRCLMRPRCLIDFLQHCRSHAVNLKHNRIELSDIRQGEASYSTDLVANINFEIRDIYPNAGDILYAFVLSNPYLNVEELELILAKNGVIEFEPQNKIIDLLLWYGFLGVIRKSDDIAYVYSVKYDMKRLKAIAAASPSGKPVYYINPAFWSGLDISKDNQSIIS
jgi:hypothetical protein